MSQGGSPIRVLYVARAPFISGAERALVSMLRHLDRARIEPHLILAHASPLLDLTRELHVKARVIALPKRGVETLLAWRSSVAALDRVVARLEPDVLHANDVPSCQALSVIGAKRKLPRVVHVRWGITAGDAAWWGAAGAEVLLCISPWVRDQLGSAAGTPLAQATIQVLPDAVDWPAEHATDGDVGPRSDAQSAASTIQNPAPNLVLGFAGQIIESKGLDLLIAAMAKVPATIRPHLLVAGKDTQRHGAYERELHQLAQSRGVAEQIEWLGFLDDVGALYRRVDVVVCPSREEPLGLVPLEAARFALPALASRVGGLAETIQDGRTGWLTEPTIEGWATGLERLLVMDRSQLKMAGLAAQERTRTEYSPMVYQRRLLAVYEALAAPRA